MSTTDSYREGGESDALAALEAARAERRRLGERIAARTPGEEPDPETAADVLRRVADARTRFERLLEGYEDEATGTGNFETYIEFQDETGRLLQELDEDLPAHDAFEEAGEVLQQRRLSKSDFEAGREALAPADELVELLDSWREAHQRERDAEQAVEERIADLDDEIADLERLRTLGTADLDAPVEDLREPVGAYDEGVTDAFRSFRREVPAREMLALLDDAGAYPLVDVDPPPPDLLAYVRESSAGEEPVPTLLSYAEHSRSKLDHYVDDPGELKARVATNRSYLERLDAEPLRIGWPPPTAEPVRWRCRELRPLVERLDPDLVARLRTVRDLARSPEYERLRTAARARAELTAAERERILDGDVAADLEAAREERERLRAALDQS